MHALDNGICVTCGPHEFVDGLCETCSDNEPLSENEHALLTALDELSPVRAAWDPGKHPRNPKGSPGGGRFRSMVDRLKDAIEAHGKGTGDGHPFDGFTREQLRRVARARGIELKRGESRESIADKLLHGLSGHPGDVPGPRKPKRTPPVTDLPSYYFDFLNTTVRFQGGPHAGEQAARARAELVRQGHLTPHAVTKLHSVSATTENLPSGRAFLDLVGGNTGAYYTYATSRNTIVVSPYALDSPDIFDRDFDTGHSHGHFSQAEGSGLETVIAHEYGHHVDKQITGGTGGYQAEDADRLFPVISDALGIPWDIGPGRAVSKQQFDAWIIDHSDEIQTMVSKYGVTSGREFMAEVWAEYSTNPDPRPAIVAIGEVIRQLGEEKSR